MSRFTSGFRRFPVALVVVAIVAGALATAAIAKALTLKVLKHATVMSVQGTTTHPNVVVNARGFVVYILTGDSRHHPQCTSKKCMKAWPPVKVRSAKQLTRAKGVKGKLGTWRHNGFTQVTLNGHPLYTFAFDSSAGVATGEGIATFGGVWHVMRASGKPLSPATTSPGGY